MLRIPWKSSRTSDAPPYKVSKCSLSGIGRLRFATERGATDPATRAIRRGLQLGPLAAFGRNAMRGRHKLMDLGASLGVISIPVTAATKCRTLMVEALPMNCFLLEKSVQLSGLCGVSIVNAAAWDESGSVVHVKGTSAHGTVTKEAVGVEVQTVAVDDLACEHDFWDVDLVKMDIEGSEMRALRGMQELFDRNDHVEFIFEANGAHCVAQGYMPSDLLRFFEERGYSLYMLAGGLLVPRTSADFQELSLSDYFATKRSSVSDLGIVKSEIALDKRVQSVVRCMNHRIAGYRQFMAAELRRAPQELLAEPEVREGLARLKQDSVEAVARAAEWWQ